MAVFQITLHLIPRSWAEEQGFAVDRLYENDYAETAQAWIGRQPEIDIDVLFSKILPVSQSWDAALSCWGSDRKHDIEVWRENGIIESIGFRLDLREDIFNLMSQLIAAAHELHCVIFVPGQHILIEPNIFQLKRYIMQSNAAQFVKDPQTFLLEAALTGASHNVNPVCTMSTK